MERTDQVAARRAEMYPVAAAHHPKVGGGTLLAAFVAAEAAFAEEMVLGRWTNGGLGALLLLLLVLRLVSA